MCVSLLIISEPTRWFSQMTPDEHPRRHHLADGPLSSLYAPSPSLSSFGAASVMMCCSARPASSSAPSVLPEDRIGRNIICIRRCCDHIDVLHIFDQTCIVGPPLLSPPHPPTPQPSRWPALTTLPVFAKFQLVWRRLCEAVRLSSSLVGHNHRRCCLVSSSTS